MKPVLVETIKLSKSFTIDCERNDVIDELDLKINSNEFLCILGYTGCGKSTLLRILAGFESPDEGDVLIAGTSHHSPTRDVIMIFQDYNQLFPWKTALGNVVYAIRTVHRDKSKREANETAMSLLSEVGLEDFCNYYPYQLSGGMRQRVAVARAIALEPKILLMDEPFAALDEINRLKLQTMCRRLFVERGLTIVFVTHSIEEAISLADRIVVMGKQKGNVLIDMPNAALHSKDYDVRFKVREEILKVLRSNIILGEDQALSEIINAYGIGSTYFTRQDFYQDNADIINALRLAQAEAIGLIAADLEGVAETLSSIFELEPQHIVDAMKMCPPTPVYSGYDKLATLLYDIGLIDNTPTKFEDLFNYEDLDHE